jgi:Xaa-Pro dipeptidase
MWRRREIRQGDVVLLESAGCVNRYHAMLSRPVVVGKPSRHEAEAADTLKRALEAAIRTIRPGVMAGDVDRACRSIIEERGFGGYFWQEVGTVLGSASHRVGRKATFAVFAQTAHWFSSQI